jgi:peptidoglycan hydrolase-like protein with peptidoglycan-binding domain
VEEVVKRNGGPEAPTATTTTPAGPGLVRPGDEGPEVQSLQQRLAQLGYRPGTADGHFGPATALAVMAFQKHEGLSPDSIVGPEVRNRLEAPTGAGPRDPAAGPRLQVDLDRQIAFFTDGGGAVSVINVSSGSGEEYVDAGGTTDVAYTPTGDYSVIRVVDGLDVAPLGTLYRPLYFVAGWAVHGSPSVPGYPASHGCVRASNADQDFLFPLMPLGSPISVYGTSRGSPDRAAPGF